MLSIPTDCPQREKAGWTGDIGIYARTALLNEDITAFLNRWLLSVGAEQAASGAIPLVVPYDGNYPYTELMFGAMFDETEIFGSSGWGDCCISVPYAMYCVTGDTEVIRKNLVMMEKSPGNLIGIFGTEGIIRAIGWCPAFPKKQSKIRRTIIFIR